MPVHAAVRDLIAGCGGVASAGSAREWAARLIEAAPNDRAREFVTRLAVEAIEAPRKDGEPDARYAEAVLARVEELAVSRQISGAQVAVAAAEPGGARQEYNRMFGDLVAWSSAGKRCWSGRPGRSEPAWPVSSWWLLTRRAVLWQVAASGIRCTSVQMAPALLA